MAKSTKTPRTTKISLPKVNASQIKQEKTLPYNGNVVSEKGFAFSFACFDRSHKLFNLGSEKGTQTIEGAWFLELLDCLKNISKSTVPELIKSSYDLHRIDWERTNTTPPCDNEQLEYWQFRINKSKGRVIGFLLDGIFYIVWLDAHHNLTDSEGYGTATYYARPKSCYELLIEKNEALNKEIQNLSLENERLLNILEDYTNPAFT